MSAVNSGTMRLAVTGAGGRMGRTLLATIDAMDGCSIGGAVEQAGSPLIGQDICVLTGGDPRGILIGDDAGVVFAQVDGVLDFTVPAASAAFADKAAAAGIVHVIGTTGFAAEHESAIAKAAEKTTIVKAGNMSLGVNLLLAVTRKVAAALDQDFDIEIVEMHHKHKVDAPSGTALMLGEAAAAGRGVTLADKSVRVRDGHTGARRAGDIGFATLRGGSVVGDHTVVFAGEGERIELSHRAADRGIFARGAVKAAMWARERPPGLYDMMDVLGL